MCKSSCDRNMRAYRTTQVLRGTSSLQQMKFNVLSKKINAVFLNIYINTFVERRCLKVKLRQIFTYMYGT